MRKDKVRTKILRATLIALGILWVCQFFDGFWGQTAKGTHLVYGWISKHSLLLFGVAVCVIGVLWNRVWDLWTWIRGLIGNLERAFGLCALTIGAFMISIGALAISLIGPGCSFIMIWIGVLALMFTPRKEIEPPLDSYHRAHLVERLADLLLQTPESIRRIGILAEWGEGKTQVMKLLEHEIRTRNADKFRMAWVNPWRSESHSDAWVEIARGVDRALGFPRLLPHSLLSIPVVGSILELLPKPLSGFTADLKTLLSSHGAAADKIAAGLSEFLKLRNQWLLIFIDDMERVGADELRKIFPVVDRLVELERCYFIFAIDPKRIAKAFDEDSTHSDETKGYLDKVLDFQLSLPLASKGEVLEMLQSRIETNACPKLSVALPKLKDFLPTNPRLADRFLRDADGQERMFLCRFGPDEENYEGFFLLLILGICFPLAYQKLKDNLDDFDGIGFLARKGMFGSDAAEDQKHKEFLQKVTEGLAAHEVMPAKKLLDRLTHLAAHLLIFDEGQPALNFTWAFEGYRKLIRFSAADRLKFRETWRKQSGKHSIALMLREINDYNDEDLVVREALKMEIEGMGNGFNHAYKLFRSEEDLEPLQLELEKLISNFIAHAAAIKDGKMGTLDTMIFNEEIFYAWLETAQKTPLHGLTDTFKSALLPVRQKLTKALAELLPPEKYRRWAWHDVWSIVHLAQEGAKAALKEEFLPVREEILNELTAEFANILRSNRLTDETLPQWLSKSRLYDLADPTRWLLNAKEDSQPSLDALGKDASGNALLRENFAILISKAILGVYDGYPDDILLYDSHARSHIEKHPWLLSKCWKAAWSGELPEKVATNLNDLRNKAINTEKRLVENRQSDSKILNLLVALESPPGSLMQNELPPNNQETE